MKRFINILAASEIFTGISENAILNFIQSPICYKKNFAAGSTIYECGQNIEYAGIILEGTVDIIQPSLCGHDIIVGRLLPGNTFGASFAISQELNTLNDIRSITDSTILFLNIREIFRHNYKQQAEQLRLIENIMSSLAQSNIRLNTKVLILSQKSLREKILTYLHTLSVQTHSSQITLPFNREHLASYLGSERSSVCRELSKLQDEGFLQIKQNHITLLNFSA